MNKVIQIRVIPRAGRNTVENFGNGFKIRLTASAVDGKANKALIEIIAEHFNLKKSQVKILKGEKSRNKLISLD